MEPFTRVYKRRDPRCAEKRQPNQLGDANSFGAGLSARRKLHLMHSLQVDVLVVVTRVETPVVNTGGGNQAAHWGGTGGDVNP